MNKNLHRIYVGSFFLITIAALLFIGLNGYSYYITSIEDRFWNPNDSYLKPSGLLGHGFGIIGTLMMIVGVSVYMLRKRYPKTFKFGYLKHWLEFHIFLCTLGPIIVLYHTAFKFGGLVSISFWSMVLVVVSGVIGRFIYVQIPRTIQGNEMDMKEIISMREDIAEKLSHEITFNAKMLNKLSTLAALERYKSIGFINAISLYFTDLFRLQFLYYNIKKNMNEAGLSKLKKKEILHKAKNEIVLSRRIGMLQTMQKLFKYWHIAHLPFAIAMFVIMVIHVIVTVVFGYRWIL